MKVSKVLGLILIGLLVYGNAVFNGFVSDDDVQLVRTTDVHSLTNITSYFRGSTFTNGGLAVGLYYKPLMTTAFALLYAFFGANPVGYHFIQIALHIAVSILVYKLFERVLKHDLLAWFLAVIFLVHPINSQPAVYISSYQDVLFLLFGLSALLVPSPIGASLFLLASMLSKETGIVMAFIAVLYYVLYRRNTLKIFLLSLIGSFTIYGLLRFWVAHVPFSASAVVPIASLPFFNRLTNIPSIMFYYLGTLFWPSKLALEHQWVITNLSWSAFTIPLIADTAFLSFLTIGALMLKKYHSKWLTPYLFFTFWFIASFTFHLQLFPLDVTASDRLFYLPMVGLLGLVGSFIMFLRTRLNIPPRNMRGIVAILCIILIALSIRTYLRTFDWRSTLTLCTHDLTSSPDNFALEHNCGLELFRLKKSDEAIKYFERSIEIQPRWWASYNALGIIYLLKGNTTRAESYYKLSIAQGPFYDAYVNLGLLYLKEKNYKKAVSILEEAAQRFQPTPDITRALAQAYYYTGQTEKARLAAEQLIKLDPAPINQELYKLITENSL